MGDAISAALISITAGATSKPNWPADAQALIRKYAFVADVPGLTRRIDEELSRQLEAVSAALRVGRPSP